MDTICHICARGFDSTSALRTHIKNEQNRLIRDVQDFSTKPYLPISYALTIILRHALHSNDVGQGLVNPPNHRNGPACQPGPTHDERDFICPYCDASPRTYQGLQRHYMQHVECNETCPFCRKPFNRLSQFIRHPVECAARKKRKLEIPEYVSKRQRTLASDAHEKLRLAQRDHEIPIQNETNVIPHSSISNSSRPASPLNDNPLAGSGPLQSSIANAQCITGHRRMDEFRNHGTTEPLHVPLPGDRGETTPYSYTDMGAAERVTDSHVDRTSTGKVAQQAPMLTDAVVDGGVPSTEGASLPGMDFPYLSELFPLQTPDMRAPVLSNSLIDGAALVQQDGMEGIYTHVPDLLPSSTISVQRAPTLRDSLVDGTMLCFESHRYATMHNEASVVEPSSTLNPDAAVEVHNPFGSGIRGGHGAGSFQ